ncbi:pentatricopeptide repeat-containing protein at2g35030 mitochondrial [Phtheirospermum japonicum]|uniref:Pentatricopeptide repeat-containing protein at2g35030 mitochondrial n=1 Tax=Phtheirospermum japonicum TaxID=374723 RepID=A0A830B6C1_9LAMI|nr:pentatricopeptide repeat-containing protein at2g35030 mitochondrial [Phtheirospermum japonicum]
MLVSHRSSRSLRHVLNFIKTTPLTKKASGFSIPREDYTLNQDVAKANYTITRLCQDGKIFEARDLFEEMPERDVISWTALISGHVKCGLINEAREFFDRVDAEKNVVTWTAMISGYLKTKRLSDAEKLFDEMPHKNVVAWNTMIDGYLRCGRLKQALEVFDKMGERNIVSWNTVISGFVNCGYIEKAWDVFDQMPTRNVISWTIMVSGLARNGRVDEARFLFDRMPERNVVSWNAMINGYAQNTRLREAYDLFLTMPEKDVKSWNTMITGFIQNGELEIAKRLFNEMPAKNVVSWTAIISGCVQNGESEEGLRTFYLMTRDKKRVKPNEHTFVSILGACSNLAGLSEGTQAHQVISKTAYQESKFVVSALINMYSKCGELKMARRVFNDGLRGHRDLISWNSMINAYAHHGRGKEAIRVFEEMRDSGFGPDCVTYVGLLSACSHAGLVEEGLNYFNALLRDESVEVREDHYTCVVDLYGRAGRLKEAFELIQRLPMKVSGHAWGALLWGCNVHGNIDIGKLVAEKILEVEPTNANVYVVLSNMYTSSGEWKEAERMKMKMKDEGLKKQPGCSWIEVGNEVHVFVVGDGSHRECGAIRLLLFNIHEKMRRIGDGVLENVLMCDNFLFDLF